MLVGMPCPAMALTIAKIIKLIIDPNERDDLTLERIQGLEVWLLSSAPTLPRVETAVDKRVSR